MEVGNRPKSCTYQTKKKLIIIKKLHLSPIFWVTLRKASNILRPQLPHLWTGNEKFGLKFPIVVFMNEEKAFWEGRVGRGSIDTIIIFFLQQLSNNIYCTYKIIFYS